MDPETGKIKTLPSKPLRFSLNNVVFSAEDLANKIHELPKHSVIIYDEGRSGLEGKSHTSKENKIMANVMQECGVFGHVIIIVLPDFFTLHHSYACDRSLWLCNVFNKSWKRGFFGFYGKDQKEKLYHFGKQRVGTKARYSASRTDFPGKFTRWIPLDEEEYNRAKKKALNKKHRERKRKQEFLDV